MAISLFTSLWFDGQAEAAVDFYCGIFPDSRVLATTRWGNVGPGPKGSVLVMDFELAGRRFMALNGGPEFRFNEAHSVVVECETQAEVDHYWSKLGEGGSLGPCGWLKDKFGLSWQITPRRLVEMLRDKDTARADQVMTTMMKMKKLDLAALEAAFKG